MTDIDKLNSTNAGYLARQLDAKDGKQDGKINASIWNEFVKETAGTGKEIKYSITVENARKSITTYLQRMLSKEENAGKTADSLAQEWSESDEYKDVKPREATPEEGAKGTKKATKNEKTATETEQVQQDYESINFTVPIETVKSKKPTNKAQVDSIIAHQKEGYQLGKDLVKLNNEIAEKRLTKNEIRQFEALLSKINKDNVIYVLRAVPNLPELIDGFDLLGNGLDKNDVIKYVYTPLVEKAEEFGWGIKDKPNEDYSDFSIKWANKASLKAIQNDIKEMTDFLIKREKNVIDKFNKEMTAYNKEFNEVKAKNPEVQKIFDDANKLFAELANMDKSKYKITSGQDDGSNWKRAQLPAPDNRWIKVFYDANGEIASINISHDTTPDTRDNGTKFDGSDVNYTKYRAYYDYDKTNADWEGSITSGYDFEKLKVLAEKIFGK